MSEARRALRATGLSMFPCIPPGSLLEVEPCRPDEIEPGSVLCYVAANGALLAHRVIRVEDGPDGRTFLVRGDARATCEQVPATTAAFRLLRVSYGPLSYSTDGAVGRRLAELAVRDGLVWRGGRWLSNRIGVPLLPSHDRSRLRRPLRAGVRARVLDGDAFASFVETEWGVSATDPTYGRLIDEHSRGDRILIAAFLMGRPVGGAAVSRLWRRVGIDELFVGGLWVRTGLKGIGIGGEMVRVALREARGRFDDRFVYANISADNEASLRLFEKAGFETYENDEMIKSIEEALLSSTGQKKPQLLVRRPCRERSDSAK